MPAMPACAICRRPTRLSAEALRHGQRQVVRMLHDRPAMAQFGTDSVFLRGWAARKFAGEDFGTPIDWDPSPPVHSDAEHLAPGGGEHAAILVEADYTSGPKQGRRERSRNSGPGGLRVAQRHFRAGVRPAEQRGRPREGVESRPSWPAS